MPKKNQNSTQDVSELLLSSMATAPKATSKKGGVTPTLKECGELADRVHKSYKAFKDSEANFRLVEQELLALTGPQYEADAKKGEFSKSIDVPGVETSGVKVTYTDQFSSLPISEKATLKDRLGDRFDTYFEEKRVLTVADPSNEVVQLLLKKLGEDDFKKIFTIGMTIEAKPDMDRKQFELAEDIRPKQNKASVKAK